MLRNYLTSDDRYCRKKILNYRRREGKFWTHKDVAVFIQNSIIEDWDDDISENEIDYFSGRAVGTKQARHDDIGINHGFRKKSFSGFFCFF